MPIKSASVSIVIRCGQDLAGLKRCLASIDQPADVIASAAGNFSAIKKLSRNRFRMVRHQYGNWSEAAEIGLKAAKFNDIIIMDADSVFASGAVDIINKALKAGNLFVQPRVRFLNTGFISRLIGNARTHENRFFPKTYSPGLGIKKKEVLAKMGVGGNIYNLKVLYGDDGYLDQTAKSKGIKVVVVKKAVIIHDPIGLKHELLTHFRFGRGQYQLEGNKPRGLAAQIKEEYFSSGAGDYYRTAFRNFGTATIAFMVFSRLFYLAGYTAEMVKSDLNL